MKNHRVFVMSVSVESLFTPDKLAQELEWLKARDTLLGDNEVKQDVKRALELAAASEHPKCQWLFSLFAEKTASTIKAVHAVFVADKKKSPASRCFSALLSDPVDYVLLRQSADLGYALAQAQRGKTATASGYDRFQVAIHALTSA